MNPYAEDACIRLASGFFLAIYLQASGVLGILNVEYDEVGGHLADAGPAQFDDEVVQTAPIEDKDAGTGHRMPRDYSWFLLADKERALNAGLLPVLSRNQL